MKSVLVLLAIAAVALAKFQYPEEWELWKKQHGKQYDTDEEELSRQMVWEANRNYVQNHNEHADVFGFTLTMNEFADMESSEFAQMYNGYKSRPDIEPGEPFVPTVSVADLPDSIDWRQKGYVTEIKNQGQCGSCWAFSTTGSLEGQHFNATGKLVSLSEQNLMDCSRPEGDQSCSGGLMDNAFKYIIKNGGIDTEASYPYKAHDEKKCKYKAANLGATMTSYRDIKKKSESDLQVAVGTVGPISVAIDASHTSFQLYDSGVYYERKCSQTMLDHGVLAVGYGSNGEKDFWLVKNSWGKSWGQKGYIMMTRNKNNNCGIATSASFPVV